MKIDQAEWQEISKLRDNPLKRRIFFILKEASNAINLGQTDDPQLLEIVPRLAQLMPQRPELNSFAQAFSTLARATGLWNYIDKESADTQDLLLAETVTVPELGGITLHREQIAALNDLLAGRNLILSAPTSFGKSLLIDALLASGKYKRVAIVLPTIALLDEFRRRLRRRFDKHFQIAMHPSDTPALDAPTIFLGTQERLLHRTDIGRLDLTVVDEFYKLDPNRRDGRSMTLNAAVYKLLNKSKQFFFLGPNIDNVLFTTNGKWKFDFLRTRFSTVAVDTFDLRKIDNKQERLFDEIGEDKNWPALVFVTSPAKANRLASDAAAQMAVSDNSLEFSEWLAENAGSGWGLVNTVKYGFGIHHGRIPRAIASHMVRLFNNGDLPVLFCTSTLIEGVNTAAKTVLIYDKAINRVDYDFFTYSNIKGRAGRLGEHHVGKVFLFNTPPDREVMDVAPTLFGDDDVAPDDYVVHLDETFTSKGIDSRIVALKLALNLNAEGLRLAASVGLEDALALKRHVSNALQSGADLVWNSYPSYSQIRAVLDVVCKVKRANEFGAFTASSLTYLINTLRATKSMKEFLVEQDKKYKGKPDDQDIIFKFLRACEYGLPQYFSIVEMFVKQSYAGADYSVFLQGLASWFRAEELKNLDEEGVPMQISERFHRGENKVLLVEKLLKLARSRSKLMSSFERRWVLSALEIDSGPRDA